MCPTPLGRLETRTAIFWVPLIIAGILALIDKEVGWLVIAGIYLLLGIFLDAAIYSWAVRWQPPWMTFVLAVVEWGLLIVLTQVLFNNLFDGNAGPAGIEIWEASVYYWVSWILAIWAKLSILPIINLTYIESAAEFRAPAWSIPPQNVAVPIIASTEDAKKGPGKLVREASGAHAIPLERIPSPSGVHKRPPIPERTA